jgi:hypothetical protein
MGVPMFNLGVGISAGWFVGRKMVLPQVTPTIFAKQVANARVLITSIFAIFCLVSAMIALHDPYTLLAIYRACLDCPFQ